MVDTEQLLQGFADFGSRVERSEALRGLIKRKAAASNKDHPLFLAGLDRIISDIPPESNPVERLAMAADLGRVWSTVRGLRARIDAQLAEGIGSEFPAAKLLEEGDDRNYLALILGRCSAPWLDDYRARNAVTEISAEKARKSYIEGLFSSGTTLVYGFDKLARSLPEFQPDTENPGDSSAKRLKRIVVAIVPTLRSVERPEGEGFGETLRAFFSALFDGRSRPETPSVAVDLIETSGQLVHELVRTRLTLVSDVDTYRAFLVFRRWLSKEDWIVLATKSDVVRKLIKDVSDAITLLGRQRIADQELASLLADLSGRRKDADAVMKEIAETQSRIHPDVVAWLREGGRVRERQSLETALDSAAMSSDQSLATLMIEATRVSASISQFESDQMAELEVVEPEHAHSVAEILDQAAFILRRIKAVAEARGLLLDGRIDEVIEFDPFYHEVSDGSDIGVRKVRIVKPAVVRKTHRGENEPVVKALVDAVD